MLKGIPKIIPPNLLKVLCEMGHGDRIVLADANYPSESMGKNTTVIRMDGHNIPEILEAILQLMPLDTYLTKPVTLMEVVPGDTAETPIWDTYKEILEKYDSRGEDCISHVERFRFYQATTSAHCIVATGESALYANIMLQKGVIRE